MIGLLEKYFMRRTFGDKMESNVVVVEFESSLEVRLTTPLNHESTIAWYIWEDDIVTGTSLGSAQQFSVLVDGSVPRPRHADDMPTKGS